jgi:hypothetical protein
LAIELDTPTMARGMPTKIKRRAGFPAANQVKGRLHQTEHPNAMPATERSPGQPGVALEFFISPRGLPFGHGCDPPGYVDVMLKPFYFPSIFLAANGLASNWWTSAG